jgi:hypothetical protein
MRGEKCEAIFYKIIFMFKKQDIHFALEILWEETAWEFDRYWRLTCGWISETPPVSGVSETTTNHT